MSAFGSAITSSAFGPAIRSSAFETQLVFFNYIPVFGQSLSVGDQGFPLTHTAYTFAEDQVSLYNNVPPTGPGFEVGIIAGDVVSLIDYVESLKETHGWGMLNQMDQLGVLGDRWLYVSTGVGGKTIEELFGTATGHAWGYDNTVFAYSAASAITPVDHTLRIPFMVWIHGEANSLTWETYNGLLRSGHDNLMADTGQIFPLLMDQTGKLASLDIANELLQYTLNNTDAHLVLAKYWLNRSYNGDVGHLHLNANGYMLQGEYFGRAAAALLNGTEVENVYPESWTVDASYLKLTVVFHVPAGASLVVDTTLLPAAPALGMGFKYIPIFSFVAADSYIQSGNTIEFTFPQAITTEAEINIGNTLSDAGSTDGVLLPCINLRDNSPDISPTQGINLYNWCAQSKLPVTATDGALDREVDNIWIYGDFDGALSASEIGLGKGTDWLLTGMSTVRVDLDCVVRSGAGRIYVGDTPQNFSTGSLSFTATINTALRMFIQGLTGGFDGSVSNVVITKLT